MRSSPTEATAAAMAPPTAPPMEPITGDTPDFAPEAIDIRQRSRLKRLLPQTMFGRSLLLIVMPLVAVQVIATWVFYARHWETVSRRLSADTAGDIGMVIDGLKYVDTPIELTRWLENASGLTGIG